MASGNVALLPSGQQQMLSGPIQRLSSLDGLLKARDSKAMLRPSEPESVPAPPLAVVGKVMRKPGIEQ